MKNHFHRSLCLFAVVCSALVIMERPGQAGSDQMTGSGTVSSETGRTSKQGTDAARSAVTGSVKNAVLSPYAEEVARIIKFDREVMILVKEASAAHIHRLIGYDENGYQIIAPGIAVPVPDDRSDDILAALRRKLRPRQYMAFIVEMNAGLKTDMIGILKGTDQYELLRVMQTNGDDYDISNQDIIDRLKEWEKCCSFDIIGAENDWVEIEFKSLPEDLKAFAEEVYEFSPDAVDQGWGSVDGLIKEIKKTNRLFLWWD